MIRVLNDIKFLRAHSQNYNPNSRPYSTIKYVVVHYTGNVNDTAKNNVEYFNNTVTQSSAHYFVSEKDIYQSVPDDHAAYAVGLGSRKEPWIKNPSMYKVITNSNSISVEICGSKYSNEGSETTKDTAAKLVADLLEVYDLSPQCVYRHYDVTGKICPAWAVNDPLKWLEFKTKVCNYFYGKEDDDMQDNEQNYQVFKRFMDRYNSELAHADATWEGPAMTYAEARGAIKDGRPKSNITRGEVAQIIMNLGI